MKWLLFACALALGNDCRAPIVTGSGRIEVIAKDATGRKLAIARTEVLDAMNQAVDVSAPLPYGRYLLRIVVPGFRTAERTVNLYQPALTVREQFVFDMIGCAELQSIHGRIKAMPAGRELFVKVVPILGAGGAESRVGSYGDFLIAGLDSGSYLLIVMDGDKAIHTETVSASDRTSLSIKL